MFPSPALIQKHKKAPDWVGVRRRLVQKTNIGRGDTTFLAHYSQRHGGARADVARARPSLPRATASMIITYSRVRINRVRLPILVVVS